MLRILLFTISAYAALVMDSVTPANIGVNFNVRVYMDDGVGGIDTLFTDDITLYSDGCNLYGTLTQAAVSGETTFSVACASVASNF